VAHGLPLHLVNRLLSFRHNSARLLSRSPQNLVCLRPDLSSRISFIVGRVHCCRLRRVCGYWLSYRVVVLDINDTIGFVERNNRKIKVVYAPRFVARSHKKIAGALGRDGLNEDVIIAALNYECPFT
jgi:hypothetical protein